jgi:hypothetical protein
MPSLTLRAQLIPFIFLPTLWLGCASQNINPHAARSETGYVDIFDPEGRAFSWDIRNARGGRSLYTEFKPRTGIVRLALSPGAYELTITILNTTISEPAIVQVQVVDGQLTPVRVRLSEEGITQVQRAHTQVPGRYTRRTKITAEEAQTFRINADVLPPMPYRPKEQVPYALK